ncbi:hypothetical protein ASPWEDRAFT_94891, partial [Aspergillus wentii DTO 134E9]
SRQTLQSAAPSSQIQSTTDAEDPSSNVRVSGTLRLRGEDVPDTTENNQDRASNRRIRWSEDVVDNEGMGKKSSKVCCIYHKSRPVGESSSESESSSSSSSDSDSDSESHNHARRVSASHSIQGRSGSPGENPPSQFLGRGRGACCSQHQDRKSKRRKPSPNAYEKMPKPSKG